MGKVKKVVRSLEQDTLEVPQEGVLEQLGPNDVLFGRGTGISSFAGNINYRCIVWEYRVSASQCSRTVH